MGLLNDIEASAVSSSVAIVDLLRQCKVLAARLKHKEFADWVNSELNGYLNPDEVPEYRIIYLSSPVGDFSGPFGSGLRNAPIPLTLIPADFREFLYKRKISQPLAEVEDLSKSDGNLMFPWPGDVIAFMQKEAIYQNMVLVSARSNIAPAIFKGIIDTVRTRVLDYVLAIQAENPDADLAKPADPAPIPIKTLHQTFNTTIIGGQANVGGQGTQAIYGENNSSISHKNFINEISDKNILKLLSELNEAALKLNIPDKNEAIAAIQRVETQIKQGSLDLSRIKSYLDIAGSITKLAPTALKLYEHLVQYIK